MVTMGRGEFKAYMCNVINLCDDAFFAKMCELFLTLCGVIDDSGELTEAYANSPYWSVEDGILKPIENAELLQQLSPNVRQAIENMDKESQSNGNGDDE